MRGREGHTRRRASLRLLAVLAAASTIASVALAASPVAEAATASKGPASFRGAGPPKTVLPSPRSRTGPRHIQRRTPSLIQPFGSAQRKAAARSRSSNTVAPGSGLPALGGSWNPLGPQPIQNLYTYGSVSGRITALAADPTNALVIYAGAAGGGVWKSTDGGSTWSPLTDFQPTLAIGALAIDPSNTQTIYAGTGEANRCADCQDSQGILKSTDGGSTWTLLGQVGFGGGGLAVAALVVDRTNSNHILAATNVGLVQSNDGGASWSLNTSLQAVSTVTSPAVDAIIQDPSTSSRFYAAVSERCNGYGFIAVSTDGGVTWPSANAGKLVGYASLGYPKIARIGLGAGPGGVLYAALAACPTTSPLWYDGQLVAVLKSTTGGIPGQWTRRTPDANLPDFFHETGNAYNGWYANVVAVSQSDTNKAVFGGTTLVTTADGDATFTDVGQPYQGGPLHPDMHAVAITGSSSFYVGTDGGVWSTTDFGGTGKSTDWKNLNATLAVTTFYSGSALDLNHMIGGAQDEGTSGIVPGGPSVPVWKPLLGGDGTLTAMDPTPGSNVIYGETPFGGIWKGTTANTADPNFTGWQYAGPCNVSSDPACSEPAEFVAPFVMDPTSPLRLYAATNRVYRTTTSGTPGGAAAWTPISPDLTTGVMQFPSGDDISAMAIDGPNWIVTGSFGGLVYVTSNATDPNPTWTRIDCCNSYLPHFNSSQFTGEPWITSVAIHAGEVWVTIGTQTGPRVFEGINTGPYQWTDVTGNMPYPALVTAVARDPGSAGFTATLYIGTSAGPLVCGTCGYPNFFASWSSLGSQVPNARVDAINVTNGMSAIVEWSHGRGAYSIPHTTAIAANPASIDAGTGTVGEANAGVPLTINGTGTTTSTNLSLTLGGANPGDFRFDTGPGSPCAGGSIAPGRSCTTSITFKPTTAGDRAATLTIGDSQGASIVVPLRGKGIAPVVSLSATSVGFGDVGVSTRAQGPTITLSNTGSVNLDITGWSVDGPNATEFDGRGGYCGAPTTIRPSGSCAFAPAFLPVTAGANKTATITITDNAGDSPQHITLTGNGVVPAVSYSPSSLTFGDQVVRSTSGASAVTFNNNGPGNFIIPCCSGPNPTFSGANPGDFSAVPSPECNNSIAPSQTCQVSVYFRPTAVGARTATLSIKDNATGSPHTVSLTGNGIPSPAALTPTAVDFGTQTIGVKTAPTTVILMNNGATTLAVSSVSLSDNYAGFTISTNTCTGANLSQGSSCAVSIQFDPWRLIAVSAQLQFFDNAPDQVQNVPLTGKGTGPAVALSPDPVVGLGSQRVGITSNPQTVTVTNVGDAPLTVAAASATGDFHAASGCSASIAPNATCTISVTFTPTAVGNRTGALTITDNAGNSPQGLTLTGLGTMPAAAPSPTSLTFGSQPVGTTTPGQQVTIASSGNDILHISAVSASGDFAVSATTCLNGTGFYGGASCSVTVTFTPTALGLRAGTLAITDDAADSPQSVSLFGTGLTSDWERLGGSLTSSPAATSWGPNRLDVFARGRDLALYHEWWDGSSWHYWERLGGTLSSDPAVVSWGPNRIDVFARGQDIALYHMWWDGTTWHYWERLGGTLASNPSASTWGPGRLDLYAAGQDTALYHMWTADSGATWNYWTRLGGTLTTDPAAASWGNNELDVFAAGQDRALYHKKSTDGGFTWSAWDRLGGTLSSSPAVSTWGSTRLDCFALGQDKAMYHQWSTDGTTFNGWQPLGGTFSLTPTAASRAAGIVDVFARGADAALWHRAVGG